MSPAFMSLSGLLTGVIMLVPVGAIAYLLVAIACLLRFRGDTAQMVPILPGMTLLKPLCGAEPHLDVALRSFCRQAYPGPLQIVFGVRSYDDPALAVARRLKHEFWDRAIDIVVDPSVHGPNLKVSNLVNMDRLTRHDIVVVSDSDVVVDTNCLMRVAASFADPAIGAATCLFRGRPAECNSLVGQLGALYIDAYFLPAALVDAMLFSQSVCYGPVTAIRRSVLEAGGGFRSLAYTLADDTELGHLTTRSGQQIALVPIAADTIVAERDLSDLLHHELRWARTTRALRPGSYVVSVLTHALPIAFVLVLVSPGPVTGLLFGATAALRAVLLSLVRRRFGRAVGAIWPAPWLLVVRECLYFGVWLAGFFGQSIVWRGRRLRVLPGARIAEEHNDAFGSANSASAKAGLS